MIELLTLIAHGLIRVSSQTIGQIHWELSTAIFSIGDIFNKVSILAGFTHSRAIRTVQTIRILAYSFTLVPGIIIDLKSRIAVPAFGTFVALADGSTICDRRLTA